MGLVFFCTWIIGGLGGGGVQNHLECLSNIIHLANPLYHFLCPQFISHSPPPLPLLSVVRNKQGVFATINIHLQAIFFIMLKKCLLQ